jgi:SAM-dependent methyltransferase
LSPTMISEARRRAAAAGLACRFAVADASRLQLDEQFDLVLGVTVLQHILDATLLQSALAAMAGHLAPGGRMVLLEAAPAGGVEKCNSSVFVARPREGYLELMRNCGLEVRAITGVDPAPFRRDLLPHVRNLSRAASCALLLAASAASLPINALFGRRAVERSWHAVFVLQRPGDY